MGPAQNTNIRYEILSDKARRYAKKFEESSDTILFADLYGSSVSTHGEISGLLNEVADKLDSYHELVLRLNKKIPSGP